MASKYSEENCFDRVLFDMTEAELQARNSKRRHGEDPYCKLLGIDPPTPIVGEEPRQRLQIWYILRVTRLGCCVYIVDRIPFDSVEELPGIRVALYGCYVRVKPSRD
jgi:hypothetical protein